MKRILQTTLLLCLAMPLSTAVPASAHHGKGGYHRPETKVTYYRAAKPKVRRAAKPKVRAYVVRPVGGYSYTSRDVTGSYRANVRALWGGLIDRQSPFGPFDTGFFFDSAIHPHGGYAPYQH